MYAKNKTIIDVGKEIINKINNKNQFIFIIIYNKKLYQKFRGNFDFPFVFKGKTFLKIFQSLCI